MDRRPEVNKTLCGPCASRAQFYQTIHTMFYRKDGPHGDTGCKTNSSKEKARAAPEHKAVVADRTARHLYLLINNYLPMIGIFLAFKDYSYIKGPFKSNWCGFKNFEFLFRSDAAFTMIRNTLAYNVVFIITTTVLAITLAIMMNELNKLTISKFFRVACSCPTWFPWLLFLTWFTLS